jgi:hypothetical protein
MNLWFYPASIATGISIVGLTYIAVKGYDAERPRSLSELAASEQRTLRNFRYVLLICGPLFGMTTSGFIMPQVDHPALVGLFGAFMVGGEMLAAIIPARNRTLLAHTILAQVMGVGMLGLAFMFATGLEVYHVAEWVLTVLMGIAGVLTFLDVRRYLVYELIFIFSSHITIVLAALALR